MKNTEPKKICPIRIAGQGFSYDCLGEDCAWWQDYANDCAVSVVAGILADSTICQNVWEEEKHDAEV